MNTKRSLTIKGLRMMILHVSSLTIIVAILLSACKPTPGTPPAKTKKPGTEMPSTAIAIPGDSGLEVVDDGSPLPPRVIAQQPEDGATLSPHGVISLTFDQAMDAKKTASAWAVLDSDGNRVPGDISWTKPNMMQFTPSSPYKSGVLYLVSLSTDATSAEGVALSEPFGFRFVATGDLQITQVFPADGATEVANNAVVTVIFNRPVVPLVIAEEQEKLPNPIEISPQVSGKGEWVNTSVFAFRPDKPLKGGVTYTATVKAGLTDTTKEVRLAESYTWRFSTVTPGIESLSLSNGIVNPEDYLPDVLLDEYFTLRFFQPMDRLSTEKNLSIISQNGEKVLFEQEWNEEFTQVIITPTQRLALNTAYTFNLSANAQSLDGGTLSKGLEWHFTTVPEPAILYTRPANRTVQDNFSNDFYIKFASPMRIDTVKDRIVITPKPDGEVQWWYNEWDWSMVGFFLKPSTRYEVQFLPGMEDIYGNKIQQPLTVSFTTAAYAPSAGLLMPYDTSLMRANGPEEAQEFFVDYRNVEGIQLKLSQLTPLQFMGLITYQTSPYEFVPDETSLIWQKYEASQAKLNERVVKSFRPTTSDGERLPPGFYFLSLDASKVYKSGFYADQRLFVVASANLTFKSSTTDGLIWLTDLETGKPLPNVTVKVYDKSFQEIGSGKTDKDGLLYLKLPEPADPYESRFAIAQDGEVFAFSSSQWGAGVLTGDFGLWGSYYPPANQPIVYIYTERPIYRPGQPVYFKGIVRLNDDLDYNIPSMEKVHVTILNYQETVYEEDLSLSDMGTFDGKLVLDPEAALGSYDIQVRSPGGLDPIGMLSFTVAEYRRPEFQVQVSAKPQNVLTGQTFTAEVSADYYSGGGVADAEVSWTLTSEIFTFTPPDEYSGYSFSDFEEDVYYYSETWEPSEVIAEGRGKTDASGKFTITIPVDISKAKTSRILTFEATVTDLSQSSVSGRASITAHKSAVYPGIRPKSYVGIVGEEQTFEFVLLDWDGKPQAGRKVSLEIVERRWHSVQEQDATGRVTWKSEVEEIPVATFDEITLDARGKGSASFTPQVGGVFRAKITALDDQGNPARASAYLWVAGKDFVPWRQTNDKRFDLISDKKSYTPGETAEILIASPFQGAAYALVTVERGRTRRQEVIRLETNSTVYPLRLTPDMAPNVFVSVLVVKGVDEFNLRPNFKIGFVELKVSVRQQSLTVELKADKTQAGPGDQVTYTLRTLDFQGKPVQAEVSLSLSDLATLSLLPPNSEPIVDYFYSKAYLLVWTSVPLGLALDEFNEDIRKQTVSGIGMGSGGGKGFGELGVVEVRQEFPDTAFWEAYIQTDENGEARVTVTLPDNLTTWRMDARAVTEDTRVGQTTLDIVSTKPLLVRPQTPRFFIVGDKARLGTAVHNNTDQALSVEVKLTGQGLRILGDATQKVEIAAKSQVYVVWDTIVDMNATRVDLVFSAKGGGYQDASRPPMGTLDNQGLPVYRYEARETVGTSGQMSSAGTRVEAISLPETWATSQGELTIKVSPSLAAGMTDALTYLESYPYDCVEQTISSFLPNVITTRALKAAGLSDAKLEGNLRLQVDAAMQRLYNWQNADGGWGWWSNMQSDPLTSAYVLLGLVEAKDAGYKVSKEVADRAINYLRTRLITVRDLTDPNLLNRQAFLLYVLARAGKPEVSGGVKLFEKRQSLALYARAMLAHAIYIVDSADPRLKTLLSDFTSAAITSATGSHWEEKEFDRWNWNTNTRTTAIILSALSKLDAQNPLNANAVRWLMSNRTNGHWMGTQETAWTLMALTNWMVASGELKANYKYAVALNGKRLGGGFATPQTVRQTMEWKADVTNLLTDQLNRLAFARDSGPGNLYYTAHLNVSLPVEQVKALDRGVIVSRSYYRLDDQTQPVTEAKQGELLLVRLTVVAPNDLHYLIVDDPLPAGLEGVDQSLLTSPRSVEVPQVPAQLSWDDMFWRGWGWWSFNHIQMRDERVVLSADFLPAGTYVYTYMVRAGTVGTFQTIPPTAFEFYFPEVYGRGEGSLFTVTP